MALLFPEQFNQNKSGVLDRKVHHHELQKPRDFFAAGRYCFIFFSASLPMEIELELLTQETDAVAVMQKAIELAKKAKELGFTIKELEIENEEEEEEEK